MRWTFRSSKWVCTTTEINVAIFSTLSRKRNDFFKKVAEHKKCVFIFFEKIAQNIFFIPRRINPLKPTDHYSGRTAPLTSKRCILYIYSTNISTEYFKCGVYCPFFLFKIQVCFIILTYLVPVLFTFYIQVC